MKAAVLVAPVGVRRDTGEGKRVCAGGELAGVGIENVALVAVLGPPLVEAGGGERKKLFELETELVRVCSEESRLVAGLRGGGSDDTWSSVPVGEEGRTFLIVHDGEEDED